ncbi:MAG: heme-binding domain-containing protein [Pyrinomonadaceae bacterium]|nr:heme-binding domain-containing protein [Pyrinomonadaceae bacterium]
MKKILKILASLLFLAFIVIQFIRPDFTNPPIVQGQTLEEVTQVPENVQALLKKSCNDCHSNTTNYPWYSYIQPSASFLENHITVGRNKVNFSVWKTYDAKKQRRKLAEVCEEVQGKEMPLPSYLWIHWDAKLTDADIKTICDWTDAERAKIPEE